MFTRYSTIFLSPLPTPLDRDVLSTSSNEKRSAVFRTWLPQNKHSTDPMHSVKPPLRSIYACVNPPLEGWTRTQGSNTHPLPHLILQNSDESVGEIVRGNLRLATLRMRSSFKFLRSISSLKATPSNLMAAI